MRSVTVDSNRVFTRDDPGELGFRSGLGRLREASSPCNVDNMVACQISIDFDL